MNEVLEAARFFFSLYDNEAIALLLTLPRFYGFLASSQLFNSTVIPGIARTATVLSLAIVAVPINLAYAAEFERTVPNVALYFIKELAIGFVIGYLVGWIFWAVQSAGALIDNQRGAAIAASIDPLQGHETSPLGIMFSQVFLTYIFSTGAILPMIGLIYESFVLWPATRGIPILSDAFPELVLGLADEAMRFTVVLAGPIIAIMFLAEFALAIVSRFAPQVQVFVLAMPIKSALAIFMLIFYFSILLPAAEDKLDEFGGYMRTFYNLMQFAMPAPGTPAPEVLP